MSPTDPTWPNSAPAPVEPPADMRHAARVHRQLHAAYLEVGFDERQAMQLLVAHIWASTQSGPPDAP